jgi:acetyl-CoA carboxylase carboxyltransferase component
MAGPAFEPEATIALPTAKIAVMGADAAINAVYANKIAALPPDEAEQYVADLKAEYEADIDVIHLASELVVDAVIEPEELRRELIRRYAASRDKDRSFSRRRHGVTPI